MSVEEQMQYWFEKSVDNVGISFTEFQRTSGYQIRHLYGLEGGKKDYEVPKCSTIATSYFCPFVHLAPALLIKFLSTNYLTQKKSRVPSEKQLEKIVTQSANNPTEACTSYFPLIYGKPSYRKIVHPLQWARVAMKLEGLVKEPETQNPAMNQEKREDQ
jgi:DNA primase large subunit